LYTFARHDLMYSDLIFTCNKWWIHNYY